MLLSCYRQQAADVVPKLIRKMPRTEINFTVFPVRASFFVNPGPDMQSAHLGYGGSFAMFVFDCDSKYWPMVAAGDEMEIKP